MERLRSDDAEISYEIQGSGSPVIPDLRGHGDSEIGEGPALMAKHARDVARVMDAAGVGKAAFVVCSIGGYIAFEFWRRFRERVSSLVLCDTRPQPDTPEARSNRLKAAADVLEQGTEPFFESMIPKLMGETTVGTRPDLVEGARRMMRKMSPQDISLVQRGMAERPDSVGDLKTIKVPTLIVIGEEDVLSTVADGELMRQSIAGSQLRVVPKAGHYAPWEQPEPVGKILRQFLDEVVVT
jgi:3-oxoadipate enol-lactonase